MIQTKTIAMILLIDITTVGAIGIGIATQSVKGQDGEVNPSTGNPHPPGEPTGNPHQAPHCSGNPHGQPQGGFHGACHGAQ